MVNDDLHQRLREQSVARAAKHAECNGDGEVEPRSERGIAEPGTTGEPNQTDLGNAWRVVERHGHNLRYCHPMKSWYCWDGRRWALDQTGEAMRRVKETAVALGQEAALQLTALGSDDKAERARLMKLLAHALKWEDAKRLSACLELLKTEESIPILPHQMDPDPWALNVLNGTIDLRTGQLRPHRREDLLTKLCPVAYDPAATCPLWLKVLWRILGARQSLIDYVRRVVGYSLTADVREQVLWLLYGLGSNGKSTFLLTLRELFGDYAIQAVSELLMAKNNEAHPTERMDLFGKRFVATIETEEGKRLAEALVKQLTGGDNLRARGMKKDFIEFPQTWKLFLACNHKPVVRGGDLAIWRRIKLVPFTVTIPDKDKDKELPGKLRAEWPGILRWAVEGCLAWQRDGLNEPEEVREATTRYQAEQDTLSAFIGECCRTSTTARVVASKLYDAYCNYSGDKCTTAIAFGKKIEERGFERRRGHGGYTFYHGICLEEPEQKGADEWAG